MEKIALKMMDSNQLILDIKLGNVDAFKEFFESFYPSLCLFTNKYLKDPDASRDIAQDAFLSLWNLKKDFHSITSAKSYLFKYVKNRSLNYLRDQKQRKSINFEQLGSDVFFRDNLIEEETYQTIYEAIRNLPPQGQRVIELSLDGLTNLEIAKQLNIALNTVKTIKLRAFKSLREELKENVFVLFTILFSKKSE
jgi:RNA polymerase sigma-70 factor (ECF subfamily)